LDILNVDEISRDCFQQDGLHRTAHVSVALLCDVFGERLVSRGIRPPMSPDLSPPDFYLWGAMKVPVYKDNPHTLRRRKEAIANFIMNISHAELVRVFANEIKWVNTCL
jgi:hypothetical protein